MIEREILLGAIEKATNTSLILSRAMDLAEDSMRKIKAWDINLLHAARVKIDVIRMQMNMIQCYTNELHERTRALSKPINEC